ncbi:MAG: hypothetical protein KGL39_25370 [Patescibacteria group bacterium]|nr:hypothetical protein [Patescibacteria group bacterium]
MNFLQTSQPNSTGQVQGLVAPTPKQMQIPEAHNRVEKSLEELHAIISILEERLQPALRPEPATPSASIAQPKSCPSTIYEKLNDNADSIQCACKHIGELLLLLEM